MSSRFASITQYAKLCGVSRAAIWHREEAGKLVVERDPDKTGKVVPCINLEEYPPVYRRPAGRPRKVKS